MESHFREKAIHFRLLSQSRSQKCVELFFGQNRRRQNLEEFRRNVCLGAQRPPQMYYVTSAMVQHTCFIRLKEKFTFRHLSWNILRPFGVPTFRLWRQIFQVLLGLFDNLVASSDFSFRPTMQLSPTSNVPILIFTFDEDKNSAKIRPVRFIILHPNWFIS